MRGHGIGVLFHFLTTSDKVVTVNRFVELRESCRHYKNPRQVAFISGYFDVLREDDCRFIRDAAQMGALFVGLYNDDAYRRAILRSPINHEQRRAKILAAIDCVEAVALIHRAQLGNLLTSLEPDLVAVKHGDEAPWSGVTRTVPQTTDDVPDFHRRLLPIND